VRIEKWQALGNDYLIVEARELPWELTPPRIRRLCSVHTGVGSDGVLVIAAAADPAYVAELRIFNPDGSEAELSGNGAREAVMYLRRSGWTDHDEFAILTAAGPIRPTITGPTTCRVDMGRASLTSPDYPGGAADGRGELQAGGRRWAFQHVSLGNPQCAISVADEDVLRALDLGAIGPDIERHPLFPNRTNVSWFTPLQQPVARGSAIRARIFERGGASPVSVRLDGGELEADVGQDLRVTLTGWAVPILRGELSDELERELRETE
jgi:diaminopimelate epimerase